MELMELMGVLWSFAVVAGVRVLQCFDSDGDTSLVTAVEATTAGTVAAGV